MLHKHRIHEVLVKSDDWISFNFSLTDKIDLNYDYFITIYDQNMPMMLSIIFQNYDYV